MRVQGKYLLHETRLPTRLLYSFESLLEEQAQVRDQHTESQKAHQAE
jgi:hypothetical protein